MHSVVTAITRMSSSASMLVAVGFVQICGCSEMHPLDLGHDDQRDAMLSHDAHGDAEDVVAVDGGDGAASDFADVVPLEVPPDRLDMMVVIAGCDQGCVIIDVVANGGNPPYRFAWEDGPTTAMRSFCPGADIMYAIEVSDRPDLDGSLHYAGQTVRTGLTAKVIGCPESYQIATQSLP